MDAKALFATLCLIIVYITALFVWKIPAKIDRKLMALGYEQQIMYNAVNKSLVYIPTPASTAHDYNMDPNYPKFPITKLQMQKLLFADPPIKGMAFIAQKVLGKAEFPARLKNAHPYLKTRTYPNEKREDKCNGCFPYIYHNVLPVVGCNDTPSVEMVILVTTTPEQGDRRQAIRETWGKNTDKVRTLFLFGIGWPEKLQNALYDEHVQYGDILQDAYVDSYFNLSIKVLSGYKWWETQCKTAKYVMRTAEDTFVNTAGLLWMMNQKATWEKKLIGQCWGGARALRDIHNKWYVDIHEYPKPRYPKYCVGTTFLSTSELTQIILKEAPNVPYFVIEDVYFGLVLEKALGGNAIASLRGFNAGPPAMGKTPCKLAKDWKSFHGVGTTKLMRWIWSNCEGSHPNE